MLAIRSERVSESKLNKTIATSDKIRQPFDDKMKQTSDSFVDEYTFEEKINDLSLMHKNIQTDFLRKKL